MRKNRIMILLTAIIAVALITLVSCFLIIRDITSLNHDITNKNIRLDAYEARLGVKESLLFKKQVADEKFVALRDSGYVNSENLRDDINAAATEYNVRILSDAQSSPSTSGSITYTTTNLTVSGTAANITAFVDYFEHSEKGAYSLTSVAYSYSASSCSASLVLRLAEPAL